MHVNGDLKHLEPEDVIDICQRLLEFLPDPLEDGRVYWPSKSEEAAARVHYYVERLGMSREEARTVVAGKMNLPRAKVAQADRDYRAKIAAKTAHADRD